MKKHILLYLATALVLSACVKDQTMETVSDRMETVTFEASASVDTKTSLVDGTKVYWCYGDELAVKGAGSPFTNSLDFGETAAETSFTGEVETADEYYAVYPYNAFRYWEGTVAHMYSDPMQGGRFDMLGPIITAAKTTSQDKSFSFKNLLGLIHFKIDHDHDMIRAVIVKSNGREPLTGTFTVDCAADTPEVTVTEGQYFSSIHANSGIGGGDFYLSLFPGTYAEGFTFEFISLDGRIASVSLDRSVTIEAGHIYPIGTLGGVDWEYINDDPYNLIWEGRFYTGNFISLESFRYGNYDWSKCNPGDVLRITGEPAYQDLDTWCVALRNGMGGLFGNLEGNHFDKTEVSVVLTKDNIDSFVNEGLIFTGKDFIITGIELVRKKSKTNIIWSGETYINWTGMTDLSWGGYDWSTVEAGTVLSVLMDFSDEPDYAIVRFSDGSWTALPSTVTDSGTGDIFIDKPSGQKTMSMVLTEEDIQVLNDNGGLVMTGDQYTLLQVTLLDNSDTPEDTDQGETVVWEGPLECMDFMTHTLGYDNDWWRDNDLKVGQKIRFYLTPSDPDGWSLSIYEGHWYAMDDIYYDSYLTDVSDGYIDMEVTRAIRTLFTHKEYWGGAINVIADNLTLNKISIVTE